MATNENCRCDGVATGSGFHSKYVSSNRIGLHSIRRNLALGARSAFKRLIVRIALAGILSPEPSYALKYVVLFLIIVIVGGEGSFKGSFVAAMALGLIDTIGKYFFTEVAAYLLYAAVFVLLLWRPQGLLPPKSVA